MQAKMVVRMTPEQAARDARRRNNEPSAERGQVWGTDAEMEASVRAAQETSERRAIESMIDDIREYTEARHPGGGFSFNMNIDKAVDRVRRFLNER